MQQKAKKVERLTNADRSLVVVTQDWSAAKEFLKAYQMKLHRYPCGFHLKLLPPAPLSPMITEAQELGYLQMLLRSLAAADSFASLAEAVDDIDLLQSHTEFQSIYDRCGAVLAERPSGYRPSVPAEDGLKGDANRT